MDWKKLDDPRPSEPDGSCQPMSKEELASAAHAAWQTGPSLSGTLNCMNKKRIPGLDPATRRALEKAAREAEKTVAQINAPLLAKIEKSLNLDIFKQLNLGKDISEAFASMAPPIIEYEILRSLTILPANTALIAQVSEALAVEFTGITENMAEAFKVSSAFRSINEQMAQAFANISVPSIDFTKFNFPKLQLPDIDFRQLLVDFPGNLDEHWDQLSELADLAIHTGIPIAWAAPVDLLTALLAAETDEECHALLVTNQSMILDHLSEVMSDRQGPWSTAANEVIRAAQAGHYSAAQSHAANLVDSIILQTYTQPRLATNEAGPRQAARAHAATDIEPEQSIRAFAEQLTIRPVFPAFEKWYPGSPIPTHFNRHATAHCVGQPDVFTESFAIVATMLATSLARQFETGPVSEAD